MGGLPFLFVPLLANSDEVLGVAKLGYSTTRITIRGVNWLILVEKFLRIARPGLALAEEQVLMKMVST